MTGFGEAHSIEAGLAVSVEVRTINSRYFKLSLRTPEGCGAVEPQIEAVVRQRIRRGTVMVNVRVDRARMPDDYRINAEVLGSYRRQLESIHRGWELSERVPLASLLQLPGVIEDQSGRSPDVDDGLPVIQRTVEAALDRLEQMRGEEGRAMAADLRANGAAAVASLEQVAQRAPLVRDAYRARLEERLNKLLSEMDITVSPSDVLKEVGLFAERCDISEEVVRLRSHLEQFDALLADPECSGRKLEFLTQEMFREVNTIGSKANDVEISRHVIEIKALVERIREMIQNIE